MAVCVMRVVPARYAFVIHTKNPSNNDANEVCEGWRGCCGCVLDWVVGGGACVFLVARRLRHPHLSVHLLTSPLLQGGVGVR